MVNVVATRVAAELSSPVFVTAPVADRRRLFIVEKIGRVRILDLERGQLNPTPFLELAGLSGGSEQGLLGLAFHPRYEQNGFFYVNLTESSGATNIRRYAASPTNPDLADPESAQTVLVVDQPFANHNGGWIAFGPRDGFLYIGTGDGGSANDPARRAQNLNELLGKLLRIDVDGNDFPDDPNRNYAIPPGNPFVAQPAARPEIWAYGLRNPWRNSFDRTTGDLYIADVGQNQREEVNVQPASSKGGENYGWRLKEGTRVTGLDPVEGQQLVDPVHEYDHSDFRQAIIGGYVYRSPRVPELDGSYFFADHTGPIWSFRYQCGLVAELTARASELFPDDAPVAISSFGEDAAGDVYVISLSPGEVYRLEAKSPVPPSARLAAARSRAARKGRVGALRWVKPAGPRAAAPAGAPAPLTPAADAITRAVRELGIPEVEGARTAVEEARFLLQAAAEVEHALLVQYLYAAYSLDRDADDQLWRDTIAQISKEEMGHLLTVQNLLLAIGGALHFDREDPTPEGGEEEIYPFPLRLQPLTLSSLAKYVTTESPLPDQLSADVRARAEAAFALSRSATGLGINHVGVLYARLYWLFQPDETPQGPWKLSPSIGFPNRHLTASDFVAASVDRQAAPSEGWNAQEEGPYNGTIFVKMIASAADGLTALDYIARQGEGWEVTDNDETHFERFLKIFEQFVERLEQGGSWPTLPVPVNPFTADSPSPDPAIEQNRITHPKARLWADLFDLRYRMLVLELWLLMSLPRTDGKRTRLIGHAVRTQMMTAIRQITQQLVTSPRTSEASGGPSSPMAGPPFRLLAAPLPSDPGDQRQMLQDCMRDSAAICQQLETPETRPLLKRLRTADEDLAEILQV